MALLPGTKPVAAGAASDGLWGRIYDNWEADGIFDGTDDLPQPQQDEARLKQKLMAYGVAKAVKDEIVANGEAFITTSDGALQREINDAGATVDTQAPGSERSIKLR
jgi:hypothetical protein